MITHLMDATPTVRFAPVAVTLTRVPGRGDRATAAVTAFLTPFGQNNNLRTYRSGGYPLRAFAWISVLLRVRAGLVVRFTQHDVAVREDWAGDWLCRQSGSTMRLNRSALSCSPRMDLNLGARPGWNAGLPVVGLGGRVTWLAACPAGQTARAAARAGGQPARPAGATPARWDRWLSHPAHTSRRLQAPGACWESVVIRL